MDTWDKNEFTVVKEDWQDDVEDEWDASEEEDAPVVVQKPVAAAKPAPKKAPTKVQDDEPVETSLEKKLRLQKLQEAADLDNAMHLFGAEHIRADNETAGAPSKGVAKIVEVDWLDSLKPETQKDFDMIAEKLTKKLKSFEKSKFYIPFVENLAKTLVSDRDLPDIRKVAGSLTDLAALKQKEKLAAAKKPAPSLAGTKKSNMYADFGDFDDDGDGFD